MTDNDIPWIHADALLIEAAGLYLLATEQEARELNRRTGGAAPPNYENPAPPQEPGGPSPPLRQCQLHHLDTAIVIDSAGTHLTAQLHDDKGSLGDELQQAARTISLAAEITEDQGALESLRIAIAMNTDRPPHGAKDESETPQTHILQTENGLGFLFTLRWHRNHDIEDDTGCPSYGATATALIAEGQLPGAHDLHLVM